MWERDSDFLHSNRNLDTFALRKYLSLCNNLIQIHSDCFHISFSNARGSSLLSLHLSLQISNVWLSCPVTFPCVLCRQTPRSQSKYIIHSIFRQRLFCYWEKSDRQWVDSSLLFRPALHLTTFSGLSTVVSGFSLSSSGTARGPGARWLTVGTLGDAASSSR